jgi:hypothetical protein
MKVYLVFDNGEAVLSKTRYTFYSAPLIRNISLGYNSGMISLETAKKLKEAGLGWQPALHDFFAIPERGMDERVFVIGDMLATVELVQNLPTVCFQGASEWALDSLVVSEAVWLPSESQLRQELENLLLAAGRSGIILQSSLRGYRCEIPASQGWAQFTALDASEAYALAILQMLAEET